MGPTATELTRREWFYRATHCMGWCHMVAVLGTARFSPSRRMARVLRTCIISLAMEVIRGEWLYPATHCMELRVTRISKSTPMAWVFRRSVEGFIRLVP